MNELDNRWLIVLIFLSFSCAIKGMLTFGFPRSIPRCPTPPLRTNNMSTLRKQNVGPQDQALWQAINDMLSHKREATSKLQTLLACNANVNIQDPNHHNNTPLIVASATLRPDLVASLLAAKAHPNECNNSGMTPLMAVACKINGEIADMAGGIRLLDAVDGHARGVVIVEQLKMAGADVSLANQDRKRAVDLINPNCPGAEGILSMLKPKKRLQIDAS